MVNESDDLRLRPHQEKTSSRMRDEVWSTQTCVYGWSLRGIWPEDADGTDINGTSRSNTVDPVTNRQSLLATADDYGKVKLFRYPCVVPRANCKTYGGHSSHVTNIAFTHHDEWVISTGGDDRAVFQWQVIKQ